MCTKGIQRWISWQQLKTNSLQSFVPNHHHHHHSYYYICNQQRRTFEYLIDPKAIAKEEQEYTFHKRKRQDKKNDHKDKKSKKPANRFIDKTRIRVMGGTGGKGSLSSEHLLSKKSTISGSTKLRPDGGHGGNGGCVYIVANHKHHSNSLRTSTSHYRAEAGTNGTNKCKNGRNGKNLIIHVPPGVVVKQILNSDIDDGNYKYDSDYEYHKSYIKEYKEYHDVATTNNDYFESDDDDDNHNVVDDEDSGGIEYFEMTENEINNEDYTNYSSSGVAKSSSTSNSKDDVQDDSDNDSNDTKPFDEDDDYDDEDDDNNNNNNTTRQSMILADLDRHGAYVMVARGGKGGIGSMVYSNRHGPLPDARVLIEKAQPTDGEIVHLELELKCIADVGLVGYPNAGKSSLLRSISLAQPVVAPYPFTTLHPILGVVQYRDGYTIRVADIPGLIDGASMGRGKGIDFLRHIERTNVLLYIVDAACTPMERRQRYEQTQSTSTSKYNDSTSSLMIRYNDPIEDLYVLAKELESYGDGTLLDRPALIVANKIDLLPNQEKIEQVLYELKQAGTNIGIQFHKEQVLGISAGVTGVGLEQLTKELRTVVSTSKKAREESNKETIPNDQQQQQVFATL